MTITNRIHEYTKSLGIQHSNNIEGSWFNILLRPDIFTVDQVSIGVGFIDKNNTLHVKVANDLSKLKCFYGDNIDVNELQYLTEIIANEYDRINYNLAEKSIISPQISFSAPAYAAGDSVNTILENFYNRTIYFTGKKQNTINKERFQGINNTQLRDEIYEWVMTQDKYLAKQIFPSDIHHKLVFTDSNGSTQENFVELAINSMNMSGSIVSAYCKNPNSAELRILKAAIDINTTKIHYPNNKYGLFILRANEDSGISRDILNQLDDVIDENIWKLENAGVHIGSEESIAELGQNIIHWAA
ncbi:hypothetical protein DM558_06385 [Entomomonas moraniae]|uniref:Uncharacterized protein n=1 Tax=Entomomonas moraniae TaxID=2213226 RepID=A0A3Q9JIN2_9GAMM|nr:hypothetical protein [Entomomonas moraniae]AZS50425.1 hypothetical protein DM558_06385 [Entomomonas moraniae]